MLLHISFEKNLKFGFYQLWIQMVSSQVIIEAICKVKIWTGISLQIRTQKLEAIVVSRSRWSVNASNKNSHKIKRNSNFSSTFMHIQLYNRYSYMRPRVKKTTNGNMCKSSQKCWTSSQNTFCTKIVGLMSRSTKGIARDWPCTEIIIYWIRIR